MVVEIRFLLYESCKSQQLLDEDAAFDILKENNMNERDLKLVQKYMEVESSVERPVVMSRPASNSLILFMEHIKVRLTLTSTARVMPSCFQLICFKDFCLILSPENNWTNKFIQEELSSIENDPNGNNHLVFAFQILEKSLESIMKKFRKNLKLIKPPLNNLMNMIETVPSISGLKMLLALKKTL